ncbi:thermonuclease family protein [Paenibacillus puerhi]|uniref:thermonuclease family protein n=1 Tax=Paenibacillus puerhi TaxID=2692622 RepID=UPI001F38CA52|nr:thermonuclease family protein [Paenibacillus puerhi]
MKSYVLSLLLAGLMIAAAGCGVMNTGASTQESVFLQDIYKNYPELREKVHEIIQVKRVVDGDTFETSSLDKVRLIGVNTPESIGKVEPYGKEASEYSKKQLTGQTVYLFPDTGDTDKYGRLLRYVFKEGEPDMYNEKLVREGYANPMTVPPNVMYAERFTKAEREARKTGKGLWSLSSPSPASDAACSHPQIKGNINSKKEFIYHMPGGKAYEQTQAERMFCTEEEAKAAGFRKAGK